MKNLIQSVLEHTTPEYIEVPVMGENYWQVKLMKDGKLVGDLFGETKEEVESLAQMTCSIPALTRSLEKFKTILNNSIKDIEQTKLDTPGILSEYKTFLGYLTDIDEHNTLTK